MEKVLNQWRARYFWLASRLGIQKHDNNDNFELIKEWDFSKVDFPTLGKDFRYSPPWGEKVNKNTSCKYNVSNIKLAGNGIEFWNSLNPDNEDGKTPYISGGLITKDGSHLPAFGKVEVLLEIPRYKGQWPAFWTTDKLGVMPEFDVFEFMWGNNKDKYTMAGNVHYGTSYTSKKWKFDMPSTLGISGKLWRNPIKFAVEFYPHQTLYKVNNYVVYKTIRGYSPNEKVVWVNGGTHYQGPLGNGPWLSLRAKYLKFYKLKED